VKFRFEMINQAGACVMTTVSTMMLGRRVPSAARMKYFEEIGVGDTTVFGEHTFTAEEIKRFAAQFDPQPFHLDEAAAARSHFGALCASAGTPS